MSNLAKSRRQGYVRTGDVNILNHYFYVSKEYDIRMVYNGMLSGLNPYLWDPNFALPTVASNLIKAEEGAYTEDRCIGKMFLNFMLSKEVRPFCSVYVMNI